MMTKAEEDRKRYLKNREQRLLQARTYYLANKENVVRYKKEYYWKNREGILKFQGKWQKEHPQIVNVQHRTRYQVPLGTKCEFCGATSSLERHHPNYDQPLTILTLCRSCHSKIHRHRRQEVSLT